jgi:hypothetical protein
MTAGTNIMDDKMEWKIVPMFFDGTLIPPNIMVAIDPALGKMVFQKVRPLMLAGEDFFTPAMSIGNSRPVYAWFKKVKDAAAFAIWTHHDFSEHQTKGHHALSVFLPRISKEADEAALNEAAKGSVPPSGIASARTVTGPAVITFHNSPDSLDIVQYTAEGAMMGAFFGLLGADNSE